MIRRSRKIKRGGSYRTPMNPIEKFDIRIVNGHGSISPEYYYIVPENVYFLMPNTCGVPTAATDVAAQSLFQTPEEGVKTFIDRFVKGGVKAATAAPFTVYEPGDILPMHVFSFDPRLAIKDYFLRKETKHYKFGYVGVFEPGALEKFPLVNDAIVDFEAEKNNLFRVVWADLKVRIDEGVYKYSPHHPAIIQIYCIKLLNYLRSLGGKYTDYLRPFENYTVVNITREHCNSMFYYLLPLIPQNSMASRILATNRYDYSMNDIVTEIVSKRADDKPLYVLFNTCRSLLEKYSTKSAWNDNNVIKRNKPSMALVRAISAAGHTNSDPVAVNMNTINNFRETKGLSPHIQAVIKYDDLLALLGETRGVYDFSTDAEFASLMAKIESLITILSVHKPSDEAVGATKFMNSQIAEARDESMRRAAADAEAAAAEEVAKAEATKVANERELIMLKRRREKIKEDISILKRGKMNDSKKERIATLKTELASVLEQIRVLS